MAQSKSVAPGFTRQPQLERCARGSGSTHSLARAVPYLMDAVAASFRATLREYGVVGGALCVVTDVMAAQPVAYHVSYGTAHLEHEMYGLAPHTVCQIPHTVRSAGCGERGSCTHAAVSPSLTNAYAIAVILLPRAWRSPVLTAAVQ